MTKEEIFRIKKHIEIHARREPHAIKITEIMWKAVAELEHLADLEKENAELKAKNKWYSEQVCNRECAEVWGNLDKAKEIIKKLKALYFSPVVTKDDVKRQDEILAEAEQFIKDSEVEK